MKASYNGQICKAEGKYALQFETNDYTLYKMVEKICQKAVDKAVKVNEKARAAKTAAVGHL